MRPIPTPDVKSHSSFGTAMSGRTWSAETSYRYGFNGKEGDDEMSVDKGSFDFGARMYDARLGKWLSVDPKFRDAPNESPYEAFASNPVLFEDPDGERIRGSIGGLIKFYVYQARLKMKMSQAALAGNNTLMADLARQQQAIGRMRQSQTIYNLKVRDFGAEPVGRSQAFFGIQANAEKHKRNGRVDIQIDRDHPCQSLAASVTVAGLAESGNNPSWSFQQSGLVDGGVLEDQDDWWQIHAAQTSWSVDPTLSGSAMRASERSRVQLIMSLQQHPNIQSLSVGPINLNTPTDNVDPTFAGSEIRQYLNGPPTFGDVIWFNRTGSTPAFARETIISTLTILFFETYDKSGTGERKQSVRSNDEKMRWNTPEKRENDTQR